MVSIGISFFSRDSDLRNSSSHVDILKSMWIYYTISSFHPQHILILCDQYDHILILSQHILIPKNEDMIKRNEDMDSSISFLLTQALASYLISLCQAIRLSSISLLLAISLVYVRPSVLLAILLVYVRPSAIASFLSSLSLVSCQSLTSLQ